MSNVKKVEYVYDQDPRYGWVSVDLETDKKETLIIMYTDDGKCNGFNYIDGEFTPTCICHAYYEGECCCTGVEW